MKVEEVSYIKAEEEGPVPTFPRMKVEHEVRSLPVLQMSAIHIFHNFLVHPFRSFVFILHTAAEFLMQFLGIIDI
jgi:hypothetical protein